MTKQQSGFTLIELVMVIVILGILAAFALPKFADLSGDAETATCRGGLASVKSATGIVHAAWLAGGKPATVTLEGTPYTVTTGGYPDAFDIESLAGLDGFSVVLDDDTSIATAEVATVSSGDNDSFTYTEDTAASVPASGCGL